MLPDLTVAASCNDAAISLDLFSLMPVELKGPLLNAFPALERVMETLNLRLDQFMTDLTEEMYELWDNATVTEIMPGIGDLVHAVLHEIPDQLTVLTVGGKNTEWMVGDPDGCHGSVGTRMLSNNRRCSGSLGVSQAKCIRRNMVVGADLEDIEDEERRQRVRERTRLARRGRLPTKAAAEEEAAERERRSDAITPVNYTVPAPNGPATSDPADYRVRQQLVVLMKFRDHGGRSLPPREYYDNLFNARGGGGSSAPGSIRDFFAENSYYKARQLTNIFGIVSQVTPSLRHPTRAVRWALLRAHAFLGMLIGACNPMLCPLHGFRPRRSPRCSTGSRWTRPRLRPRGPGTSVSTAPGSPRSVPQ